VEYIFVLACRLVARTIGSIAGTGTSIVPVPVLACAFDPKEAAVG
jgi:uncharacterized membrane protein YfcA